MSRRVRIETPGFHHIYNRGVERRMVYEEDADKERFLQILCEVSEHYDFTIHAYALMDNHYHLLVENKRENLSNGMRQLNSLYAQYFNKKYKRVGHLWQDRYKSWYVLDENYLFTLFKYFEANPLKAGIVDRFGKYRWTILHDILNNKTLPCMRKSFVLSWYSSTGELVRSLGFDMSDDEMEVLDRMKIESNRLKRSKEKKNKSFRNIEALFENISTRPERNEKIKEAYELGYSQSEIANCLGLSISLVSRVLKNAKFKP